MMFLCLATPRVTPDFEEDDDIGREADTLFGISVPLGISASISGICSLWNSCIEFRDCM